jgi:hypothetical protein
MEDTSTPNEPTQTDVPQTGDEKVDPATQMVQEYQSQGGTPTPDQTESAVTGEPEPEPKPDDTGKVTRLEQELATTKQLLSDTLGIDPDSDVVEKFRNGLITKEDLLGTKAAEQPKSAIDRLRDHQESVKNRLKRGEPITPDDYVNGLELTEQIAIESSQHQQENERIKLFTDCKNAAESAILKDPLHTDLPDNIKEIETQMFLGATDNLLGMEAANHSDPNGFLTPDHYKFYGNKSHERYNQLRQHWIDYGAQQATKNITSTKTNINPVTSSTGSGSTTQPEQKFNWNEQKVEDAYQKYVASQQTV